MAYATPEQLTAYPVTVPAGASAELLLTRASRDVDRALLCAVYDPEDPDVIVALRDATCEQVAGHLGVGDRTGLGSTAGGGFTLGKLSVQPRTATDPDRPRRIGVLWEQAWDILQQAGLTGHGPQTP